MSAALIGFFALCLLIYIGWQMLKLLFEMDSNTRWFAISVNIFIITLIFFRS